MAQLTREVWLFSILSSSLPFLLLILFLLLFLLFSFLPLLLPHLPSTPHLSFFSPHSSFSLSSFPPSFLHSPSLSLPIYSVCCPPFLPLYFSSSFPLPLFSCPHFLFLFSLVFLFLSPLLSLLYPFLFILFLFFSPFFAFDLLSFLPFQCQSSKAGSQGWCIGGSWYVTDLEALHSHVKGSELDSESLGLLKCLM